MSARWGALLVVVAIAIAGLIFDRWRSATSVAAAVVAQPVASTIEAGMPTSSIASAEIPITASTPPINPALVKGYATSTNYREFIAFAKRDIAHGGGAYAIAAEADCDYVKAVLDAVARGSKEASTDSRDIVARAEARTLLEARCATLMPQEVGGRTFFELHRSGEDGVDPLLRLRAQLHDPRFRTDPVYRYDFIARIVESRDPLMWIQYGSLLIEGDGVKGTALFDGVGYAGKDYEALVAAMELVPCALGFDCARLDTNVAVACLQYHVCEPDRFGLEKRKAEARGYDFLRVLALQDAIVGALQSQRVAAFVKQ